MIEPLIPPQTALQDRIHGPLPTCVIPGTADPNLAYGVAVIGDAGRVADRAVLSALSWSPGTRLTMSCTEGGLVLVHAASEGPARVTGAGFFRVPFRQRRRVRLLEGDRVLLVAHREQKRLLIYPPAALDTLTRESRRILEDSL
ncbi:hypothetical protein [Nocardia sp. NPDC050717]|uniref:hypothetical protein n=1 Tax=Nocardia sp. NPDC050717 TaxID=3157221 RepID=UPI0033C398EB